MATYTHNATAVPSGIDWYNVHIGSTPAGTPTTTLLVLLNSDGTETRIIGTGFTYSGGTPTGGTITEIDRTNSGGGTVYETVTGLNKDLGILFSFSGSGDNRQSFAYLFDTSDTFNGFSGNDLFVGGAGADSFNGGSGGTDTVSYDNATAAVTANLTSPASNTGDAAGDTYVSIENLIGSDFNDTLVGDAGAKRADRRARQRHA